MSCTAAEASLREVLADTLTYWQICILCYYFCDKCSYFWLKGAAATNLLSVPKHWNMPFMVRA